MRVTVMEWERTLLFRDGRFQRVLEPGRHRIGRSARHTLVSVDIRPRVMHVTGQDLLTSDGLSLRLSMAVTWSVTEPHAFSLGAQSTEHILYGRVQDAARAVVTAAPLEDLLADRPALSANIAALITGDAPDLGLTVAEAVIRDLMLPGELRRATLETLLARERGRADLERARAESAALRSLANTARLLEDHPSLLHLRTLQAATTTPNTHLILNPPPPPPPTS
ncbi:slipin family protein [Actinocorallia sp. A-T 12471]|uniref:slipin family protein n=1 Tax=Actinocorallia sp. A-T 12471 TaxID=3089813 RepID=UPI0029CB517D|nr:slipin family protein [Actinocorallia sp. A-T 12471]MDX6742523.1 slipin family protein [Actinocorallia sp. A-T 12471]